MYHVIIIIINFEEDINRSLLELRLDLNSPELELELKCPELELELKLIVSSWIGIGIENNGIGIGIELKKWNWPQPCIRPIFSNQLWETPNNDVMGELCACPRWEFQQHASRTLATLSIDQSLSISHCQSTSNSHHTPMINHYCSKKIIIVQDFISFVLCSCWMQQW